MDAFWSKVRKTDTCWLWLAAKTPTGYGRYADGYAHRFAYELLVDLIPHKMTVDHLCRVKACCNPAHMEIVTRGENAIRGGGIDASAAKRKALTHCSKGHRYTPENTGTKPNGSRKCLACRAAIVAKWNAIRDAKLRGRKAIGVDEANGSAASSVSCN